MSEVASLDAELDGRSFAMTGPMKITDPAHTPVRGDLAHVRLAGKFFVPHYAVPARYRVVAAGAQLLSSLRSDADVLGDLASGSLFEVLDVAGGKAWGQAGGADADVNGPVGYVSMDQLEPEA
ncbi:MAG: SH3 domain-containing protein [Novosphingobium sp.]